MKRKSRLVLLVVTLALICHPAFAETPKTAEEIFKSIEEHQERSERLEEERREREEKALSKIRERRLEILDEYGPGANSLKGIEALEVTMEDVESFAAEDGLNVRALQTYAELRLRKVGLRVVTRKESAESKGRIPYLYIRVHPLKLRHDRGYAYNVSVELKQSVNLVRASSFISHTATTWDRSAIAVGPTATMTKHVREILENLLDEFLNIYLAVNPRD